MTAARNKTILRTITLLITIFSLSFPVHPSQQLCYGEWTDAKYSGGMGEPNDPYRIATAEDLILLGDSPGDYDKHFILTDDIDLSGYIFDRAVIAPDLNDDESWFQGTAFTGVFDGNGHTISHLVIDGGGYLGLFGQLGSTAEVKNLGLADVNITSSHLYVGGLVADNNGSIVASYSTGTVAGHSSFAGGLVGHNERYASITTSYSTGTVTGHEDVGGLAGHSDGSITSCYSIVSVTGGGEWIGGLVGQHDGSMTTSFSGSTLSCHPQVGGGLVGLGGGITSCFWDIQTIGDPNMCSEAADPNCDKSYGKTTAEMQTESTFTDAGWDFVDETDNGTDDIWKIVEGQTYPLLSWQKYGGGTGEPNDPYLIYTAEHLNDLGAEPNDYDKHFKLMADIDLSGYLYDRAVIAPDVNDEEEYFQGTAFTGVFDGDDHRIMNLNMNYNKLPGNDYLGLYGCVGEDGRVSNLGLEGGSVRGPSQRQGSRWVGGLAGQNYGRVSYCYYKGVVEGWDTTGGLVGENEGCITMSYSNASVSGWEWIGGLVGAHGGSIANCYSNGTVTGSITAGLVGYNGDGNITNCYTTAAGLVVNEYNGGSITSSFFEWENCGLYTGQLGLCLTTAEMQMESTFTDAGWDFVGETANGTDDIWWIDEGKDYPHLWWELDQEN